jgi:AcrR family transcriptional regulator
MNRRSGKDSREKILEAALKIFSEYGYKGASIRMIANNARISTGGLYLYFRNKEDLYMTLMKKRFGDLVGLTREAIRDTDDPVQAVIKFINVHLEYVKNHKDLIITHGREHGFAFGIEMKRKFFEEQRSILEHIIRKGIDSGNFGQCNEQETARIIIGTLRGFFLSIVIDPDNLFSPEECCNFILSGLLRRDEGSVIINNQN